MSPNTEEVHTQLKEMLSNAIVRPSCSPWAARVILVEKKDKSLRFAVDYRGLNDITRKDAYPVPDIRDMLDKLHGSTFFSKLDGASAYWSIPIRDGDIPKTAFITPQGQYEFRVMPLGLTNAPATYQRVIDVALREATSSVAYVDDTLVFSQSIEDHVRHLRQTLELYRQAKMNYGKTSVFCSSRNRIRWTSYFPKRTPPAARRGPENKRISSTIFTARTKVFPWIN